jgi:imidazolonepropionase
MSTSVDLLIHSAAQLLTLAGPPQRGPALGKLGIIRNGAVAIQDGEILAVGQNKDLRDQYRGERTIDASGCVVLPGFIDPHTHLVWAGDRAGEFEMRLEGASYMEIMQAGGGIASTVRQVRAAPLEQLLLESRARGRRMLAHGTTTAEAKTGYGLNTETELKLLQAILRLDESEPLEIVPTFLGAHALPPELADDPRGYEKYSGQILEEMLPAVRDWWIEYAGERPLPFADVFCEEGAFDLEQTRAILNGARSLGFPLKVHADEFAGLGGTGLAVELGAVSADHLVHTPPEDISALGASDTVAVALPCTPFGLGHSEYTPASSILEAGGILALATDLNPGTAWCESMQFAIALACRMMRLTPAQAIAASTINAAAAIGRADRLGSLEAGKQADLLLLEAPDYHHLGYRFGTNLVSMVIKRGQIVIDHRGLE